MEKQQHRVSRGSGAVKSPALGRGILSTLRQLQCSIALRGGTPSAAGAGPESSASGGSVTSGEPRWIPNAGSVSKVVGVSPVQGLAIGCARGMPVDTPRPSARLGYLKSLCFREVLRFSAHSSQNRNAGVGCRGRGPDDERWLHDLAAQRTLTTAGVVLFPRDSKRWLPFRRGMRGFGSPVRGSVSVRAARVLLSRLAEACSPEGGRTNEETSA